MTFEEIQDFVSKRDYLFSEHADEERTKDTLSVLDIEQAILTGSVVEERLDDFRGESRLIAGRTEESRLIHVVVGLRFDKPVIVTVYIPSKSEWIRGTIRKRRQI